MTGVKLVAVAVRSIVKNSMRSLLTMLGVIIGVGSVIVMVGLGAGAQADVEAQIQSLGANMIMAFPNWRKAHGVSQGAESRNKLTLDDVEALREGLGLGLVLGRRSRGEQRATESQRGHPSGHWLTAPGSPRR